MGRKSIYATKTLGVSAHCLVAVLVDIDVYIDIYINVYIDVCRDMVAVDVASRDNFSLYSMEFRE